MHGTLLCTLTILVGNRVTRCLDGWVGGAVVGSLCGSSSGPTCIGDTQCTVLYLALLPILDGNRVARWLGGRSTQQYIYIYCLAPAGGRIRSQGTYCLPPAGVLHSQNKVINVSPTTSHKGGGQRYGFININDMYNNDVGKGGAQGCEAYEVK